MESADRLAGWTTVVAGLATMVVGVVLQSWWVALGTAVAAVGAFVVDWLTLPRPLHDPTPRADAARSKPNWFGRGPIEFLLLSIAKAAVCVGLALVGREIMAFEGAFVAVAVGALGAGAVQIASARRRRRAAGVPMASR